MSKASSKFSAFIWLLFAVTVTIMPAMAQNVLENYAVPMPKVADMPPEELKANTNIFTATPFADKALEYEVNIPKGWENTVLAPSEQTSLGTKIIGELARFYGPGRLIPRSYITLQAINLEYKMSAEHWVLRYLLSQGFNSKGMKKINEGRTEFAYYNVIGDATYFIHAVAQINGRRVMLFEYALPIEAWREEQVQQKAIVESFGIMNPVEEEIEKTVEYRFLDVAKIRYPETWTLKAMPIRSIDNMEVQILNINKSKVGDERTEIFIDGKMDVFLTYYYSIQSLEAEVERIKNSLQKNGLSIQERIDSKADDIGAEVKAKSKDIKLYDLKIFRASNEKNRVLDYELWMTTMQVGDYYYFFTLLTPARTDDFFVWSRNAETYKLVVKSFEPIMESLIYEE